MSPPLKLTATQRLGRRLDGLDATVRSQATRLEGLEQRVKELAEALAVTAHSGNYEAMYRLEREENIRLRQRLLLQYHDPAAGEGVVPVPWSTLASWISRIEDLAWQVHPFGRARPTNSEPLTADEQQILDQFQRQLVAGTRCTCACHDGVAIDHETGPCCHFCPLCTAYVTYCPHATT